MFEFLMLVGFLGAGLSHWQPEIKWAKGRPPEGEKAGPARGEKGENNKTPVARREFSLQPDHVIPARIWG